VSPSGNEPLRVFISYRREDSIGIAGRIRDRLTARFGPDSVFFDVDAIPLGVDFRKHIDKMVAECDVVLVIIGRRWVDAVDVGGERRLNQAGDFVRLELEAALRRDIPVVPVLVDGATIPQPSELPGSVSDLAYRNGIQVRHDPDFHPDVDRLLRRLTGASPSSVRTMSVGGSHEPERFEPHEVIYVAREGGAWTESALRRAYIESGPPMRKVLDYLAAHPDQEVTSTQTAADLALAQGVPTLAGMLGAFSSRCNSRYGIRGVPWNTRWRPIPGAEGERSETVFTMPRAVAAVFASRQS
jgi:TIR domain